MIVLVLFYTQGVPYDKGRNLTCECSRMINQYSSEFDKIVCYNPSTLREMGYGEYVSESDSTGVVSKNPNFNNIGFAAWKPLIIKLQLDKMTNPDDIVVYHDVNCSKYPIYLKYNGFRRHVLNLLDMAKYPFFVPQVPEYRIKKICKTNVIVELGENHPFSYMCKNVCVNFMIFRKSNISDEILEEWRVACLHKEWMDGIVYIKNVDGFSHHCPEQGVFSTILANWIRKGTNNIPKSFPSVYFVKRDINKQRLITDYSYLKYVMSSL